MLTNNIVWKSKNDLWEILLDRNDLIIRNTKFGTKYTVEIDKNQKVHYWFTSVEAEKVPAYILSRTERIYRDLRQSGEIY